MFIRMNRRQHWVALIASALSYVGYRVAAYNNVIVVTRNQRAFLAGSEPVARDDRAGISLFMVGDTGLASEQRKAVIGAMSQRARCAQLDGVVLLGDNFYEAGVESADDQRFQEDFERSFDSGSFDCPFHVCLGNHDHYGNAQAQVEYSDRSIRWNMPDRYFKQRLISGDQSVDLFVVDTTPIDSNDSAADAQLRWIDQQTRTSTADWKVVVGHHPCISGGRHGSSDMTRQRLAPILTRNRIALYVSGHDHDLQLIDSGHGWLQAIAGSGSKIRSTNWIPQAKFASATPGFVWLLLQDGNLSLSFFNTDGHLYTHQIARTQPKAVQPMTNDLSNELLNL